jgi:hypothetical protein
MILRVVISLLLISAASLSILNYSANLKNFNAEAAEKAWFALDYMEVLWNRYRADHETHGYSCGFTNPDTGACEDYIVTVSDKGYLPVSGWESALFPAYGFKPDFNKYFSAATIVYGIVGTTEPYFCIVLTSPDGDDRERIKLIQQRLYDGKFVPSATCGDKVALSVNDPSMTVATWYLLKDKPRPDSVW